MAITGIPVPKRLFTITSPVFIGALISILEMTLTASNSLCLEIGLAVFYFMPSPSSGKWGGVAGLKRLFRKEALKRISTREKERIGKLITEFVAPDGIVVNFQKDAYLQLRSSDNRNYSLKEAMAGKLEDVCQCDCRVRLYCFAPTRLMQKNKILLNNLRMRYSI